MRDRTTAVLLCTVCVAALSAGAVAAPGASANDGASASLQESGTQTYAVVQGDRCIELQTLGNGSQSVEEFYDYRTPETHDAPNHEYSSYGTTHLQRDDTTTMFIYEGSEGTSLVVLHESIEGSSDGGAVTMQFDGLPEDSEWAVQDDHYSDDHYGGNIDQFQHTGDSARATWAYTDGRNDGGAIRGLGGDADVTVTPYFNDEADFREYEGQISDWEVVSAEGDDYNRTSLDSMDEEVRVVAGGCGSLTVSSVTTSPTDPAPGDDVEVQATVSNDGAQAGTFTAEIVVDGEVIDTQEVSLEAGESTDISTTVQFTEKGSHDIRVADTTTTIEVGDSGGTAADVLPGFGVTVALLALLGVAVIAVSRRR